MVAQSETLKPAAKPDPVGLDLVISDDWAPKVGGAHYWLMNVYSRWGGPVVAFVATPDGDGMVVGAQSAGGPPLKVRRDAIPVANIGLDPRTWVPVLRNAAALRRLIRSEQPAGPVRLHCKANFPEGLTGLLAAFGSRRTRLFVYAHGEEILVARSSRLLGWVARKVFARADAVIVNSRNTERLVRELVPDARTVVVHPGVDASAYVVDAERRAALRHRFGWADDECVMITLARLEPRKNVEAVVRAVGRLRDAGLPVRYICVGRGEERDSIARRVAESGLADRVVLKDFVSELEKAELLAAADVHVLPSIHHGPMIEGFGIVFIEAAAAGLPSVSGLSGGQSEAVLHEQTGLNVDGDSIDALTAALGRLARDPALRVKMGDAGRTWAASLDWKYGVDRIRAITLGTTDPSE